MPAYKTTAKDVAAPFSKRTVSPVKIGELEITVYFRKGDKANGEKVTGWYANADGIEAHGANLDAATDSVIKAREAHDNKSAPVKAITLDETPLKALIVTEDEPESAPEPVKESPKGEGMNAGKVAALVMKAYRESAAAVTDYLARKITADAAEKITCKSFATIFETVADARKSGVDSGKLDRLNTYASAMVGHHNHLTAKVGGFGNRLTSAQSKRARQKLAAVAASMAA